MSEIKLEKSEIKNHHAVCECGWYSNYFDRAKVVRHSKSHIKENPKHNISITTTSVTYCFIKP